MIPLKLHCHLITQDMNFIFMGESSKFPKSRTFKTPKCLVFLMLSHLFIAYLWSSAGKELTSCSLLVMFILYFCYFPMGYPGPCVVLDCIVS